MNAPYDKLHEIIEDMATPDVPWANAAVALVAMKKRAMAEPEVASTGLTKAACDLMAQAVAEKFAFQIAAQERGLDKLAEEAGLQARFFARQLRAQGTEWDLPPVSDSIKLASMMERGAVAMQHLVNELGDDPMRYTVLSFIDQDMEHLGKLAALDQVQDKKTSVTEKVASIVRVKQQVKQAARSAVSGGALRGPDKMAMRPAQDLESKSEAAAHLYYDAKDSGQPRESKTAAEKSAFIGKLFGRAAAKAPAARTVTRVARTPVPRGPRMTPAQVQAHLAKKKAETAAKRARHAALSERYAVRQTGATLGKAAALKMARLMKLAQEAGMSVQDYLGAEQQANQQMEQNELQHVRQIAEKATQENQALAERATMAEQQLQGVQQQLTMAQQQGQMAMQTASDAEANAAEQANAKLRMKMKIDQMRQTLADLAAVNPQMDEAPGPEAGMPQPGAPPGPVQQQADAQQGAVAPQTAESAKEQQQAATAQQQAEMQAQQAAQKQQEDQQIAAAQVPLNAGAAGAPAVAPVPAPAVPAA